MKSESLPGGLCSQEAMGKMVRLLLVTPTDSRRVKTTSHATDVPTRQSLYRSPACDGLGMEQLCSGFDLGGDPLYL